MLNPLLNPSPPKSILRQVGKAIAEYDMIRDGDAILLGVSGGKDSLSLLQVLRHLQRYAPVKFQLGVVTVDPLVEGFDPSPLQAYYQQHQIPYHYQTQAIMEQAKTHMGKPSFCAYCSRMKRGVMYATARQHGYNVLALARHLDDLAESLLLSLFYGGQLRTMKAHYLNDAGDVRIIRPLVFVRERQTVDFAKQAALPVILDNCPACFKHPTQRQAMKALLQQQEQHNKTAFKSLLTALLPLLKQAVPPRPGQS